MLKLSKMPAFGFLKENAIIGATKVTHSEVLCHNIRKTIGYIPGLSLIQGIEHLVRAVQNKKNYSPHFIFRSIVEMLGLGFLLLIPDLIITCVRQHQTTTTSLQVRKIIPIATPQSIPNPVFPEKVQEFVQPIPNPIFPEKVEEFVQPDPLPLPQLPDPAVDLIKQQFKKLVGLNQIATKLTGYLDRSKLDLTNKASIDSLKQFMLEEAAQSHSAACQLLYYLYTRGALAESIEDVQFYTDFGITLAKADVDPCEFLQQLHLDISQEHCLNAVTTIACTVAKYNPKVLHKGIQNYGINTCFNIAKEAVQNDPEGTLQHLNNYNITHPKETKELENLACALGTLEEKKEKALRLGRYGFQSLILNWPYFKFDLADEQQFNVVKDIVIASFQKDPILTFNHFGPPMDTPISTPEGLAFWEEFALKVAQHSFMSTVELISQLFLTPLVDDHKPILKTIGLALLPKNPQRVRQNKHIFGLDETTIMEEIQKLRQKPLADKEVLLRDILESSTSFFLDDCKLLLTDEDEDFQFKKTLTVDLIKKNLSLLKLGHFTVLETQELILAATASATYQEANQIHKKLPTLGLKFADEFYCNLYCLLAKKDPSILSTMDQTKIPEEKRSEALREIGLSLAALDGASFKKDFKHLGFNLENERHANSVKNMLQLAIEDDGYENLDDFYPIAPELDTHVLSAKQACNLIALHIGDVIYNADDIIYHVKNEDWGSPEGVAAREELVAYLATGSLQNAYMQHSLVDIMNELPDYKKAALSIVPHDPKGFFMNRWHKLQTLGDTEGADSLLRAYVKHFGPNILSPFVAFVGTITGSDNITEDERFLFFKTVVQLSPCEIDKFPGSEEEYKILEQLAFKQGSQEERLKAALQEATFANSPILKNLPYYQLDNVTPVKIQHFSVSPLQYLEEWKNTFEPVGWLGIRNIMIKGAEKMSLEELDKRLDSMLDLQAHYAIEDEDFHFELAKIWAAKNSLTLPIGTFTLSAKQLEEVMGIAYLENQFDTINSLPQFGIPDNQLASWKMKLKQIKVQGDLQERAQKAIEAIKRSSSAFILNLSEYFTDDEVTNHKIPQEVAQAYLNASYIIQDLATFGITDPKQVAQIIYKTSQEAFNSLHLLSYDPKAFVDREMLFKILLNIAEKHPCHVLKYVQKFDLVFSNPKDLTFMRDVMKLAAKVSPEMVLEEIQALHWDFRKAEELAALTVILKEVAKNKELDKFPFKTTNLKLTQVMFEIKEEVPPAYYKGVKLL